MLLLMYSRKLEKLKRFCWKRLLSQSCTASNQIDLTNNIKHKVEKYWSNKVNHIQFDSTKPENKFYVLSMFPYPSGNLHMGHVRVYTISDTIARFYRLCGYNVFHPMGWDAFGLPAENAAIQRQIDPASWTAENITQMKEQLQQLGCSFDWAHELSTCSANYYKWTQKIFLLLYKDGLAYQNEALVNWDPVDKTVLADEQVDNNGISWRSGARVERKLLKQWFIRATAFAKDLLHGLEDPILQDWRDIINLQKHWIGECNGYGFQLMTSASNYLRIWTTKPEHLKDPCAFVVLKSTHFLSKVDNTSGLSVENPFNGTTMPIVFSDEPMFPENCEVYLAAPSFSDADKELQSKFGLAFFENDAKDLNCNKARVDVLEAAVRLKIGGYRVSSKLQDWLISRQRYWGTPIPIIHCSKCGAVPVPDDQLPVLLPANNEQELNICTCPKCGNTNATRETDTMDTFVDSSWYYLRYLDANNPNEIFDKKIIHNFMPVDLYIGGKEHAVLHLYYARFMNHFLHSKGMVPYSEPFSRLLVQGMVMGRSFRVKGTGRYVREDEVNIINPKKNQALLKDTKEPVVMGWEKMSKSKLNGVNPTDMFEEYGTDTTRLIILADVAPTSHRNWSSATFPGILNWQNRLWLTIEEFYALRTAQEDPSIDRTSDEFLAADNILFDARNYYVKGTTFNYRYTHQLSVAVSKMQGLTNSLRRAPKAVIRYGKQYELTLASQIIMLTPMAPHFASELWAKFAATPNRLNQRSDEINWENDVLDQRWPKVDPDYKLDLTIKVNGFENCVIKIPCRLINNLTYNDAMDLAFSTASVTSYLIDKKIRTTNYVLYPSIEAILNIYVDKMKSKEKSKEANTEIISPIRK